uniref:Uncharacterized protein n=1 Tax=Cucumis melo TaxID=3656 RepID=A0A9I9EAZ3_CUCME
MKVMKISEVRVELFACSRLSVADLFASRVIVSIDLRQSLSAAVCKVDLHRSSSVVILRVGHRSRLSAAVVIRGCPRFASLVAVVAAMVLG